MPNLLELARNVLAPKQPPQNPILRQMTAPARFASSAVKTFAAPMQKFGNSIGFAIQAPFEQRRLALDAQTDLGLQNMLQRQGNFPRAQMYANRSIQNTRNFADQSRQQAGRAIAGGVGTGLTVLGSKGLNTLGGAAMTFGVPTAFGAGFAKFQGQDVATGAGQGFGSSLKLSGINQLTNPILAKLNPGLASKGLAARTLIKGGANAVSNIGENELQVRVDEQRGQTPQEILFAGALGFATGSAGELVPASVRGAKGVVKQGKQNINENFLNNALDLERQILKAGNTQQRVQGGRYGSKVKLQKAVGSGNVINKEIPLVRIVQGNQEFRVSPSELLAKPELLQYYVGPANPSAQRLFKLAGQGGFIGNKGGEITLGETSTLKGDPESQKLKAPEILEGKVQLPTQKIQTVPERIDNGLGLSPSSPLRTSTEGQKIEPSKVESVVKPSNGIVPRETTQASDLNVNRLNLSPEQKARVSDSQIKEVRDVLSNEEITRIAKGAGIDTRTHSIDQTAKKIAEQLNVRRQVVELENQRTQMLKSGNVEELERVTREIAEKSRISREQGTDVARQLAARRIIANEINTPMQKVFQLMDQAGVNPDVYIKEGAKVDFNDGNQVIDFYRKFVPAGKGDWLDLIRYNSMLSSPNTFINNAVSNLQGVLLTPLEKTILGGVDALKSVLTRSPREYLAGEGPAQLKGYLKSVGKAKQAFADTMSGKSFTGNIDTRQIPLTQSSSNWRRVEKRLQFPMKLLEATDQFFTAIIKGGATEALGYREAGGIKVRNKDVLAESEAAKRLFRSDLGDNQGSYVLNAIDFLANKVQEAKGNSNPVVRTIAKYSLPFVQTPTNILKQGVEYSPFATTALPGAENKTELLAKSLMGTSIGLGVATLLGADRLSWAEPTSEKQKAAFKAAGMQPYAVKVGDKWVSYSKMHPAIAFNLAFIAAIKHADDNQDLDQTQIETLLKGLAKWTNFFADQSYVKSIGDLVSATKGDLGSPTRIVGNYAQQFIPGRALLGWVARLTDPYQRQVDPDGNILEKQLQNISMQIPGLSMTVPTRKDNFGNPIENQNRIFNAVSPARVTTEKPEAKAEYEFLKEKAQFDKEKRQTKEKMEREMMKEEPTVGQVGAAGEFVKGKGTPSIEEYKSSNKIQPLNDLEKQKVKSYIDFGKAVSEDKLTAYYTGDVINLPDSTFLEKAKKEKATYSTLNKISRDEKLSDEQKQTLYSSLGISSQDAEYYSVASSSNLEKTGYVLDSSSKLEGEALYNQLSEWRKPVNGKMILSDGVIDNLAQEGLITDSQGKALKKMDYAKGGKAKSGGKKAKKGGRITVKTPKYTPIKLKEIKPIKIKPVKKIKFKKYKPKRIKI